MNNMCSEFDTLQQCTFGVQQYVMHDGLLLNQTKGNAVQFTLEQCYCSVVEAISKSTMFASRRIFICLHCVISVNRYQMTSP